MTSKKSYTRIALVVSIVVLVVWGVMGTGTSLAWFADSAEPVKNVFHFADFDVVAEYRDADGNWKSIKGNESIFDDNALYEPGYTQIVYLRITNAGDVPFDFKTAVSVTSYSEPTNIFGQKFHLQDYLVFGLTPTVSSEVEMDAQVATREQAKEYADMPLSNYSTKIAQLEAGETVYMALIVHMPEEVDNNANYREDTIPEVKLGLIVTATQQTKD